MDNIKFLLGIESKGIKLGLERTYSLLQSCGNPHKADNIVQLVGTNGKGSTSYMIYKILSDAGYKVGLFTSPHLNRPNERIRINGTAISNKEIEGFIDIYKDEIIKYDASFFEVITVLAFWYFAKYQVDYSIMETGLGGRLDSVSACNPIALGITSISMDHKEILGDCIEDIAAEKAGAIKDNSICVSVPQEKKVSEVLTNKAKQKNANLEFVNKQLPYEINLNGEFQKINASLAVSIVEKIIKDKIDDSKIMQSLQSMNWYGRIQIIKRRPLVIFDVCHNEESISGFISYISQLRVDGKKYLIIALQRRKEIDGVINKLVDNFDSITVSSTGIRNSLDVGILKNKFNYKTTVSEDSLEGAIESFHKSSDKTDLLAIIGSHYIGPVISNFYKINFDNL